MGSHFAPPFSSLKQQQDFAERTLARSSHEWQTMASLLLFRDDTKEEI
jgi:hypothetical protein